MAKSVGSVAKRSSRRCFTRESVAMPIPARTVLPAKLAAAEKHMERFLRCGKYMKWERRRSIFLFECDIGWVACCGVLPQARRTGKSACATGRRYLIRYYSVLTADMLPCRQTS